VEVAVRHLRSLVEELCLAVAVFDPALVSGEECSDLAEVLARAATVCEAASIRTLARAVECGARGAEEDASALEWMARVRGTTAGAVRRQLETVAEMEARPEVKEAVTAGEVSLAQAAEVLSLPEHEAELLEVARSSGLRAVRDRVRTRRCEGMDPEELHTKQHAAREFKHWRDELGMIRFRGALPPETGIPFVNRVDREYDRQWRAARREKRKETQVAMMADAFVAVTQQGGEKRRKAQTDLVVVVDLSAFRRGHAHPGEVCHIVGGGPIPVSVARDLERDAFLKAVLHDGVDVHTVAHFGRHRPAHLETALRLGAPPEFAGIECSEIGCERRYGLEFDHVDPCANGGPTSLANLKPECKPHHWDKTERDRKAGLLDGNRRARAP
jgi:hypothetical protein